MKYISVFASRCLCETKSVYIGTETGREFVDRVMMISTQFSRKKQTKPDQTADGVFSILDAVTGKVPK